MTDLDRLRGGTETARSVAVSASAQLGAKVVHLALNVVSSLALIHALAPSGYGDYVYVVTVAGIVGLISDFGLVKLAVREIAAEDGSEREVLGSVLSLRIALSVVAFVLTQALLLALGASTSLRAAAAVISTLFFTEAVLSVVVVFHVRLKQQYEAVVRVVIEALETSVLLVLIAHHATLPQLMVAPAVAGCVGAVIAVGLAIWRFGYRPSFGLSRVRGLAREALPVGPTLLLAAVYLKLNSVLLAVASTSRQVGLYGAAYQPIEYLLLAAGVVINVLLPLLAHAHLGDSLRFVRLYRLGAETLLVGVIPVAIALVLAAPELVTHVYGADFAGSSASLRLLAFGLILMVMSYWQGVVLLAGGQQRITLRYDLASVCINFVVSGLLILPLGASGAAAGISLTSVVVVVCSTRAVSNRLAAHLDWSRIGAIAMANVVTAAVVVALRTAGLPAWSLVVAGATLYALILRLTGLIDLRSMAAVLTDRHAEAIARPLA